MYTSKAVFSSILAFGTAVLGIGIIRGETSISKYFELSESRQVLSSAIHKIENENKSLELEMQKIRASKLYAQKILKDKYHSTDENEFIIFLEE